MKKLEIDKENVEKTLQDVEETVQDQAMIIQQQVDQIKRLETRPGAPGLGKGHFEDAEALCYNCESLDHSTLECTQSPIIRYKL